MTLTGATEEWLDKLTKAGQRLRAARDLEQATRAAVRADVVRAAEAGVPEAVMARTLGLSRTTVRIWLGKIEQ